MSVNPFRFIRNQRRRRDQRPLDALTIATEATGTTKSSTSTSTSTSISTISHNSKSAGKNANGKNATAPKLTKAKCFRKFLDKRDFDSMYEILSNPNIDSKRWFYEQYTMLGERCLHMLLHHRPPARLVSLALQRAADYGVTEPDLEVDLLGRTPLHHAVGYGCSPEVVQVLLDSPNGRDVAIRVQDQNGSLPLHLAVLPYGLRVILAARTSKTKRQRRIILRRLAANEVLKSLEDEEEELRYLQGIMAPTVALLLRAHPSLVMERDDYAQTAMHYAEEIQFLPGFEETARKVIEDFQREEDAVLVSYIREKHIKEKNGYFYQQHKEEQNQQQPQEQQKHQQKSSSRCTSVPGFLAAPYTNGYTNKNTFDKNNENNCYYCSCKCMGNSNTAGMTRTSRQTLRSIVSLDFDLSFL